MGLYEVFFLLIVSALATGDGRRVCPSSDNMLGCVLLQGTSASWKFVSFKEMINKNKVSLNVCSIAKGLCVQRQTADQRAAGGVACNSYCESQNAGKYLEKSEAP